MTEGGPTREPDIGGSGFRAWAVKVPPSHPNLALWLCHHPGVHAVWSWWIVGAVHLREVPGMPPAKKRYPEAEHELMVVALEPGRPVPDPDAWPDTVRLLRPLELVYQCHGLADATVGRIVELMVRECAAGRMALDSDWRGRWEQMLDATVDHYRKGVHDAGGN